MTYNVPQLMKQFSQWVCWRKQPRNGHMAKLPINPRTGYYAKTNDPNTWTNYMTAVAHDDCDGIGFVLHNDSATEAGIVCIDLDDCISSGGTLSPLAENITHAMPNTYTEISQSGRGLHIFTMGILPQVIKTPQIEMYRTGRFIAMTGNTREPSELIPYLNEIKRLYEFCIEHYKLTQSTPTQTIPRLDLTELNPDPDEICLSGLTYEQALTKAMKQPKFKALYLGDWVDYYNGNPMYYRYENGEKVPDSSRADAALLAYLAFWTGKDANAMKYLFDDSALGQREKWLEREDYQERSITFAIANTDNTYSKNYRQF